MASWEPYKSILNGLKSQETRSILGYESGGPGCSQSISQESVIRTGNRNQTGLSWPSWQENKY